MGKMMSRKQMLKELTPTAEQLKEFHKALKKHGFTKKMIEQGRLDRESEA